MAEGAGLGVTLDPGETAFLFGEDQARYLVAVRQSDIAALSRTLLARYAVEFGELNLTDAALSGLMSHDWPGNVRQLGSVLYRCALMARAGTITAPDVAQAIGSTAQRAKPVASPVDALRVLKQHGGNVSAAARALRVPRSTFRAWLERAENSAA